MTAIDRMNQYTLNRNERGKWTVEGGDLYDTARLQVDTIFDWDSETKSHVVKVNIVSTGAINPTEAAEAAENIMKAAKVAEYFTDVIRAYENGELN